MPGVGVAGMLDGRVHHGLVGTQGELVVGGPHLAGKFALEQRREVAAGLKAQRALGIVKLHRVVLARRGLAQPVQGVTDVDVVVAEQAGHAGGGCRRGRRRYE